MARSLEFSPSDIYTIVKRTISVLDVVCLWDNVSLIAKLNLFIMAAKPTELGLLSALYTAESTRYHYDRVSSALHDHCGVLLFSSRD